MNGVIARELSTLLALVFVAVLLAVPAWVRERKPSAYRGVWQRVGDRLPPPRRFIVAFGIAYVVLLSLDVATSGAIFPRDPLWSVIAVGIVLAGLVAIALGVRRT